MLGRHIYTAAMSITADREGLFNEVYESEHIPALKRVAGVLSVRRFRRLDPPGRFYLAVYEITDPRVPSSPAWMEARDLGRWPTEVRPYTSGNQNGLFRWHAGFGGERLPEPTSTTAVVLVTRCADAPNLETHVDRILASLWERPGIAAAAYYRGLDRGPPLLIVAVTRADNATAADVAGSRHGPATLGSVETYVPISASEG